jgi:hypothetical protein
LFNVSKKQSKSERKKTGRGECLLTHNIHALKSLNQGCIVSEVALVCDETFKQLALLWVLQRLCTHKKLEVDAKLLGGSKETLSQ